MATRVYNTEDVELQDETVVTLRPLPIARLRKFMASWEKMNDVKENEEGYDIFVECAGIALERELSEKVDGKTKGTGDNVLSKQYREYIEEVLDMETLYKVLEVTAGLKLNDPNLMAQVAEAAAMQQEEQDGEI